MYLRKVLVWSSLFLLLLMTVPSTPTLAIQNNTASNKLVPTQDDNTVNISSDADFRSYNFPGNGTQSHPYIIEGRHITNAEVGIQIFNTRKYFIIQYNIIETTSDGIELFNATNGIIQYNELSGQSNVGIFLKTQSNYHTIIRNNISNCEYGIESDFSSFNNITMNSISDNGFYGIHFEDGSPDNWITKNNFIDNGPPENSQVFDDSGNTYEYNYYSDWTTPDQDGNGVVDDPYVIDGNGNATDDNPVTEVYQIDRVITQDTSELTDETTDTTDDTADTSLPELDLPGFSLYMTLLSFIAFVVIKQSYK